MNTYERLENYGFSPEVIDPVAAFADEISGHNTYEETFKRVGMPELKRYSADGYAPVDVIDIIPKEYDDSKAALMVHLAMANPLDPNQLYQIAAIAGTHPNRRIIAAGNPSGKGYNSGLLTAAQRKAVAGGDLGPVVEPLVQYAEDQGIDLVHQVGYSFGADRAATAAAYDAYQVHSITAIEPASVAPRGLLKMAVAFLSTGKHLEHYVQESQTPAFEAARKESVTPIAYSLGLGRLSNLAIARCLAKDGFEKRMNEAMDYQITADATIAWGDQSELADNAAVHSIVHSLAQEHGTHRVNPIVIEGGRHALANDIHLQAAIVLEGTSHAYKS